MKPFSLVSIVATLFALANTAAAQELLDCPSTVAADGVDLDAPADILHRPLAMPGAFGGEVSCLRRPTAQGIEQLFIETLPFDGEIAQELQYLDESIIYSVRIGAPDAPATEAVGCIALDDERNRCWADLGLGNRVNAIFNFRISNDSSDVSSVAISVDPGSGVLPPDMWRRIQLLDPTSPDLDLTIFVGNSDDAEMLPLSIEFEGNFGNYYFAAKDQPASDSLLAHTNRDFDIIVTATVEMVERTDTGSRLTSNRYSHTYSAGRSWLLMRKLFQINELMSVGFEGSKALSFEN